MGTSLELYFKPYLELNYHSTMKKALARLVLHKELHITLAPERKDGDEKQHK